MERLVIVLVVAVVAGAIAALISRRRPTAVPAPTGFHVPTQLHRDDFARPEAEWLVVVFTSETCNTCADIVAKVQALESDAVAVEEVEVSARGDLHRRYDIDAVPTTVIADADGVVRRHFLGPTTATDIWAAVAEVRED